MKKMLDGIKKHGLGGVGGAVNKQLGQWVEPIAEQAQKIDGRAEKHGGLDKAALAQIHTWTAPSSSDESALRREAEELEARRAAVEEIARREAEELVARKEPEELAAKKQAEKPTLKKFMLDFLRKSEDIEDDVTFSTIAKLHESQEDNATLAQMLFSLKDPVINKRSDFLVCSCDG